jgi:hypothetical protein
MRMVGCTAASSDSWRRTTAQVFGLVRQCGDTHGPRIEESARTINLITHRLRTTVKSGERNAVFNVSPTCLPNGPGSTRCSAFHPIDWHSNRVSDSASLRRRETQFSRAETKTPKRPLQFNGFVPNGAKSGLGIMSDCIRPIMLGTTKQQATALPQIDPQIVAACKERNPNFGKGGSVRTQSAI